MLNNKICRRCYNKRYTMAYLFITDWEYGYVICPPNKSQVPMVAARTWIKDEPPSNCPYLLEHVINA
jgi:hypothetical protein